VVGLRDLRRTCGGAVSVGPVQRIRPRRLAIRWLGSSAQAAATTISPACCSPTRRTARATPALPVRVAAFHSTAFPWETGDRRS